MVKPVSCKTYQQCKQLSEILNANPQEELILDSDGKTFLKSELGENAEKIKFASNKILKDALLEFNEDFIIPNCPIELECMLLPATTTCGHTFNYDAMKASLKSNGKCPLCRAETTTFSPNIALAELYAAVYQHREEQYKEIVSDLNLDEFKKSTDENAIKEIIKSKEKEIEDLKDQMEDAKEETKELLDHNPRLMLMGPVAIKHKIKKYKDEKTTLYTIRRHTDFTLAMAFSLIAMVGGITSILFTPLIGIPITVFAGVLIVAEIKETPFTTSHLVKKFIDSKIDHSQSKLDRHKSLCATAKIQKKLNIKVDQLNRIVKDYPVTQKKELEKEFSPNHVAVESRIHFRR